MKVLILTTSFPRFLGDEASLFVGALTDALSEIGVSGDIIVPRDADENPAEVRGRFTISRYRYGIFQTGKLAFRQGILPNLRKNWLLAFQIPALLAQLTIQGRRRYNNHEVLHGQWVITAVPTFFLHKLVKKPYLLTVRGEDIKLLRTPLRFLLLPFIKRASRITAVSSELAEELTKLLPQLHSKIVAVRNGVTRFSHADSETKEWREELQIPLNHRVLCYLGRVIPVKQPEVLLTILSEVVPTISTTLLFVGRVSDEYKTSLLQQAERMGVLEYVRFTHAQPPRDANALLSLADVYVSASSHEGISNSVVEALAAGIPAFLSDIPGHRLVVQPGFNGQLFDSRDPKRSGETLASLLKTPELLHQYAENGKKSVQDITWTACAKAHEEIYKKVVEEWNNPVKGLHNKDRLSETL